MTDLTKLSIEQIKQALRNNGLNGDAIVGVAFQRYAGEYHRYAAIFNRVQSNGSKIGSILVRKNPVNGGRIEATW